jgi:hypothetical protein
LIRLPLKILDLVVILLALGLTGVSAYVVYAKPRNTTRILIQGQDEKYIFPADAHETVKVRGSLGDTVVRIQDNQAWVESSPCNNQVCVAAGHLHKQGEWAACLPNNVFVMIEGTNAGVSGLPDRTAW